MKSFLRNKLTITLILVIYISWQGYSQTDCIVYDVPALKSSYINLLNETTDITEHKTIRVNIHFILRSNGTGNFTETTDYYGIQNSYTGYWFADKVIEQCNYWLNNNSEMTQQLACCPIDVLDINYDYQLVGVFFDRNDTYFNNPNLSSYLSLLKNGTNVINIMIYPTSPLGHAEAYINGNIVYKERAKDAYDEFLLYGGNWAIYNYMSLGINHEVGHCLSLEHCKRYDGGGCCTTNSEICLDDCDDTPTYQELINDGYTDPCVWNGSGYSNNIMDYSPLETAFTPCQIEKTHDLIDFAKNYFKYGVYENSTASINSFTDNASYIGNTVILSLGTSVTIPNGKRLYIDATEFQVLGSFEVPAGSVFEFTPYGM